MSPSLRVATVLLAASASLLCGCPSAPPPASQFPTADAAIDALHKTQACGTGVHATAKIDHFSEQGRVRGTLLLFATRPANLRIDAVSPFGVTLATLTSDSKDFALADLRDKRFYVGDAAPCNIARLTTAPIPGHALVSLLRGDAPVLKHQAAATSIGWEGGRYVVQVPSTNDASQELWLGVHPDDRDKPYGSQRVRLLGVTVRQYDGVLYRAVLEDHSPAKMAGPREDPDGLPGELAQPIPPSGPECHAELPRSVHIEVPSGKADVLFRYDEVEWNPPIPAGAFEQQNPGGLQQTRVSCAR